MDIQTIKAVGEYIVTPVCILLGAIAWLYFMSKD